MQALHASKGSPYASQGAIFLYLAFVFLWFVVLLVR